ncbi:hypothetical protein BG004_008096 [Podila humilis]|nr:hypothetical protein BG004_008096 [Podila humilis]
MDADNTNIDNSGGNRGGSNSCDAFVLSGAPTTTAHSQDATSDHVQSESSRSTSSMVEGLNGTKDRIIGELAGWLNTFKESDCQLLMDEAQSMGQENTKEYWSRLLKLEYQSDVSTLNFKRSLTVRKENLKQHNYFSRIMTDELQDIEQSDRPSSPSEEAVKRRRYNTRLKSTASSYSTATASSLASSSSADICNPIIPFVSVGASNPTIANTSASAATFNSTRAKVSFQEDDCEIEPDTDESYEPPSELSSNTSSPRHPLRRWIYLYPQGQGQLRYPSEFRRPWIVGENDVAGILWSLREIIVDRLPDADTFRDKRSVKELEHPHEFLALNHIYLIQRNDVSSSIFVALGDKLWQNIQAPSLDRLMDSKTVEGLFDIAVRLSTACYQVGRRVARDWDGDEAVGDVLSSLTKSSALWDVNRAQDNEATDTKKRNDPFLEAYCTHLPNTHAHWDTVFPPSDVRRSSVSDKRGTRPDYFSKVQDRGRTYYPLVVEIKKAKQGERVLMSDLEKIALQMKDSLDLMAQDKVNLEGVRVYGYTIVGKSQKQLVKHELCLYSMTIEARGIYIMREITKAYLPRSHADMSVLPTTLNLFKNLQQYLQVTVSLCNRPLLSVPYVGVTKTLGSPMKRPQAGWDAAKV